MADKNKNKNPIDFFGQTIGAGDYVVGGQGHELALYRVLRLTPKMVRIAKFNAKTDAAKKGKLRYSNELLKVDNGLVTFYVMKN